MPQLGEEVFVTPRPGLAVADAHGRPMRAGPVRWSEHWQRRLEAGDVEVLSPAQALFAPLRDEDGQPLAPPPGDLAADLASPQPIARPEGVLLEGPGSGAPREGIEVKAGEVGVLIEENGEPSSEVIR